MYKYLAVTGTVICCISLCQSIQHCLESSKRVCGDSASGLAYDKEWVVLRNVVGKYVPGYRDLVSFDSVLY